jgi:membrane protease YdiL (CAAX protease family)
MWEELGWRGYALPELQKKHNALISSLIVGIFWSLWHWPHFLVKDSVMANNYHNFFWFAVFTLLYSISHTWLYNSTKGSLLVASLYHSEVNTVNIILFADISYSVFPFYLLVTAILALVLTSIFKPDSLSHNRKVTFEQIAEEQNAKRELRKNKGKAIRENEP